MPVPLPPLSALNMAPAAQGAGNLAFPLLPLEAWFIRWCLREELHELPTLPSRLRGDGAASSAVNAECKGARTPGDEDRLVTA